MNMQKFRRGLASIASLVVGAASFALSFVALRDVAASSEAVPPYLAWLVPIVIDGGVICGSAIIWSASYESRRRPVFPFLFTGGLVVISVVVNAAHAGPSPLAKVIASLPPLILLGTLELVAAQGRSAHRGSADTPVVVTSASSTTVTAVADAPTSVAISGAGTATAAAVDAAAVTTDDTAAPPRRPAGRPRTAAATSGTRRPSSTSRAATTETVPAVGEALTGRRPLRVAAEPAEITS